jgi:hypothetical protein
MSNNDHLAALIYLKNKVHKWKNLALLFGVFALIVLFKATFGNNLTSNAIESAKTIALDAGKDYLGNRDVVSRSHHDVICLTRNRRWGR